MKDCSRWETPVAAQKTVESPATAVEAGAPMMKICKREDTPVAA
jgi:hypothetical protein